MARIKKLPDVMDDEDWSRIRMNRIVQGMKIDIEDLWKERADPILPNGPVHICNCCKCELHMPDGGKYGINKSKDYAAAPIYCNSCYDYMSIAGEYLFRKGSIELNVILGEDPLFLMEVMEGYNGVKVKVIQKE